jgi:hypothetical protein
MQKLGTNPRSFISGNICFEFALIDCFVAYLCFAFIFKSKIVQYFSDGPGVGIAELKAQSRQSSTFLTLKNSIKNILVEPMLFRIFVCSVPFWICCQLIAIGKCKSTQLSLLLYVLF